jgi:hypothetical protein
MQEALLPDTQAISRSTLEWTEYHGKQLVRYKDADGSVHRCLTASYAEADSAFELYLEMMRLAAEASKRR